MELQVIEKMTGIVSEFMGNKNIEGFARAYHLATAIKGLRSLLTPEYMAPIMDLQGNRLGFRTDKDLTKDRKKGDGYPMEIVRECLIEAVLFGVQPVGNQFNIIAGGAYITKEGYGHLLKNMPGLTWKIFPAELPRMKGESGAVKMRIEYTHNGNKGVQDLDIPMRINDYSTTDQVLGKAERKARYWLHKTVTGSETPEGEVEAEAQVMKTTLKEEAITKEELTELMALKGHLLSEDEKKRALEIIDNNETNSFPKLKNLLYAK